MRKNESTSSRFFRHRKNPKTVFKTILLTGSIALFLFLIFNHVKGILPGFEKTPDHSVALESRPQNAVSVGEDIQQIRQTDRESQFAALVPAGSGNQLLTSADGINWSAAPRNPGIYGPLLPISVAYWCLWKLLSMELPHLV